MTKRFKKEFNQLTDSGQKARLDKYEQEREERGTTQVLGRLVRDLAPSIKEIDGGAKAAYMRLAVYNTETEKTEFMTISAYIAPEKVGGDLEKYYASLKKGTLLSVEFKQNGEFKNAYGVFVRKSK